MYRPVVLVTGASSGFGAAFARRFATTGHDLVLVARRADRLAELATELEQLGARAVPMPTDLSDPGAASALHARLDEVGLRLDILVNNAGFGTHGRFSGEDPARIAQEIAVNVTAPTLLTREFLPDLVASPDGALINVASTAAFQPGPHIAVYAATKAYLHSFTAALWQEYKDSSLKVINLAPGPAETEFFDVAGSDAFKVGQVITPDQVVDAAFHELSSGARHPSVVVGGLNSAQALAARFAPTRLTLSVAAHQLEGGR